MQSIRHLYVSPGHNFFGRHGQPAGNHPTVDVKSVTCRAGWGIESDRFYGYRPGYKAQVTFFAWETLLAAREKSPSRMSRFERTRAQAIHGKTPPLPASRRARRGGESQEREEGREREEPGEPVFHATFLGVSGS